MIPSTLEKNTSISEPEQIKGEEAAAVPALLPPQDRVPPTCNNPKLTLVGTDFLDQDDFLLGQPEEEEEKAPTTKNNESDADREKELQHVEQIRRKRNERGHNRTRSLSPTPRRVHLPTAAEEPSSPLAQASRTLSRSLSANVVRETASQFAHLFAGAPLNNNLLAQDEGEQADDFEDYRIQPRDIETLVNDKDEFARLKLALKDKGAITNEMLKQRLHVYVHKNRQRLHELSGSQLDMEEDHHNDDLIIISGRTEETNY